MKGLLLKDVYMLKKRYTWLLVFVVGIAVIPRFDTIFEVLPCVIAGMIPSSMLRQDNYYKWSEYCETLPYTKAQIVSCKYLIGLLLQIALLIIMCIAKAFWLNLQGVFSWNTLGEFLAACILISCLAPSISLPAKFKYGEGQTAQGVITGIACASGSMGRLIVIFLLLTGIDIGTLILIMSAAAVFVYAFSWQLSIMFYEQREFS